MSNRRWASPIAAVAFFHRVMAGVHFMLRGCSGVAGLLDLDDRLVDTLLFDLDPGPDLLESLVGLGHVGDECRQGVGLRLRPGLRQARDGQRHRDTQGQRGDGPRCLADWPRKRTAKGGADAGSHSTLTPQFHCLSQL